MDQHVKQIVNEVDAECRRRSIPMLGPDKVARLCDWVRDAHPRLLVEVGTAIGYSGLWLADTLRELGEGHLVSLEMDPTRANEAAGYFRRAGLTEHITQLAGDARERIRDIPGPIDLLFLDGGFENYYPCLLACRQQLRDGALLVADNAGIGAKELRNPRSCRQRRHVDATAL